MGLWPVQIRWKLDLKMYFRRKCFAAIFFKLYFFCREWRSCISSRLGLGWSRTRIQEPDLRFAPKWWVSIIFCLLAFFWVTKWPLVWPLNSRKGAMFCHVDKRPTENPYLKKMVRMVCRATTNVNQKVILISLDLVTAPFDNIMKQIFI